MVLVVFKGVLPGRESPILSAVWEVVAGPQEYPAALRDLCPVAPPPAPRIRDVPGLTSLGPSLGRSSLCPQAWPHLAGSPFLFPSGSLCVHPASTPGGQQRTRGHHARNQQKLPRSCSQRLSLSSSCWVPPYLCSKHVEEALGRVLQLRRGLWG